MDLYHRGTDFVIPQSEDKKLAFRDVSYDEEAAQPTCHIHTWYHNLLMRNTSNYVAHSIKYKNNFGIDIYQFS